MDDDYLIPNSGCLLYQGLKLIQRAKKHQISVIPKQQKTLRTIGGRAELNEDDESDDADDFMEFERRIK